MRERLDRLDRRDFSCRQSLENSSGSDLSVRAPTPKTRTALYNLLDQIDTASRRCSRKGRK